MVLSASVCGLQSLAALHPESMRKSTWAVAKSVLVSQQRRMWQVEPSVSDLGSGWYLDRIEVMGPEGAVWRFPCHNWLGKSDAGDHRGACLSGVLFRAWHRLFARFVIVCCFVAGKEHADTACCWYLHMRTAVLHASQARLTGSLNADCAAQAHQYCFRLSAAAPGAVRGRHSRRRTSCKAADCGDGRGCAASPGEG